MMRYQGNLGREQGRIPDKKSLKVPASTLLRKPEKLLAQYLVVIKCETGYVQYLTTPKYELLLIVLAICS